MLTIADPRIEEYARAHSTPETELLAQVAAVTHDQTDAPGMMVGPLEGGLLSMLVHMVRPRLVVEIGTFTGYSALAMAAALPEGGRIVSCEIDEHHAALARDHIGRSPWSDRIDVRLGPAIETVEGLDGPFDMVFIDADKESYVAYYEAVVPKLAPHGIIAADNVLWSGRVVDDEAVDDATVALRAFNRHVTDDPRTEAVMLTVRDGVTLIRRSR